jgi:hypothetical protein
LTHDLGFYFYQNWRHFFSPENEHHFSFLKFNTIDLLIVAIAAGVLFRAKSERYRIVITSESLLVGGFITAVSIMLGWGVWSGGELKPALWQVRPYYHLMAICLLFTQVVRDQYDLRLVAWTLIGAGTIKAIQVIAIFFVMADGRFGDWRQIVGHDDSIFFVGLLSLLFALWLYDRDRRKRLLFLFLSLMIAVGLLLNLRRTGYVALGLILILTPFIAHQRRAVSAGIVISLGISALIYLALFWDSQDMFGIPVQKIRSVFAATSGTDDYRSNIYRTAENINLLYTIRHNPLGTGFGKPFEMYVPLGPLDFANWRFHPHNMFLGLLMSLGPIGFALYLSLMSGVMMAANFAAKQSEDRFIKALSAFCFLSVAAGLLATALDQFMWAQRGAIFTGIVIGIMSAIGSIQGRALRRAGLQLGYDGSITQSSKPS